MRKLFATCAAIAACAFAVPASARVAPPTPEQIVIMDKRQAFESHARTAFADHGLIEKLRDWRQTWGAILVGREGSAAAPRLLIKDEYGWYEMKPGRTQRLPPRLGLELDRMLNGEDLWQEDAYDFDARCDAKPRLFVIMHAGRDTFGRLGCGPEGLAERVVRTAEALRVLPGEARTTAPLRSERPHPPGTPPEYFEASNQTSAQLFEMVAAWERKTLAGFVAPYAEDVIVERPDGVLRGRKAVVDWARYLQDWDSPYAEQDRKLRMQQIVSKAQDADDVFYTMHELRWEEAGKPVRQTFSTMWRNHDGLWLIAHEKVSEVKPVTSERATW